MSRCPSSEQSPTGLPGCVEDFVGLELPANRPLHLCLGMFDGVHLGHQAVIESAVQSARLSGGIPAVLTFDPHPSRLFAPDKATQLIQPPPIKIRKLRELGIELVIVKAFTRAFAAVPAEDFMPMLRKHLPTLCCVYAGANFRFGQKRAGDVDLLIASGKNLGVNVLSCERIRRNGEPISSTRIRGELQAGNIAAANDLLGYHYFSEGTIVAGQRKGRQLGFPTLNLPWAPQCQPRYGVYAVRLNGQPGVANYGVKPTLGEGFEPTLETHLLGECTLGEDDKVCVEWLDFVRPEQKFPNLEALKKQIANDRAKVTGYFN